MFEKTPEYPPLPPDDPQRSLTIAQPDTDQTLPHIGVVGDTYTITVSGDQTNGRFCVIDMHIPPGGGPPPHRHDFEETFILLDGEVEATFVERNPSSRPATLSTSPQTLRTNSTTVLQAPCACSAFVRPLARRTSSWSLARRSQPGRHRRRSSAPTSRQPS